jgi:hypothetical protein
MKSNKGNKINQNNLIEDMAIDKMLAVIKARRARQKADARKIEDDDHCECPRRSDTEIHNAYVEIQDKVWWNRHQVWLLKIASGEYQLTEAEKPFHEGGNKAAKRIERKYGKKNLWMDDFHLGLINGQMSALAWVMGTSWEDSLDT